MMFAMLSLSETQAQFRAAVETPDSPVPAMLVAPAPLAGRLDIYRRHYREGLTRHLLGRYPTVEWLLGSRRMIAVLDRFIVQSPPIAPCMAEYGQALIAALRADAVAQDVPYVADVAELDWHLGNVSVAIDQPALEITRLAEFPGEMLPDLVLNLQPGLRFMTAGWPVDELVRIRLSEQQPETLAFAPGAVALQLRGARGTFGIARLTPAVLAFRAALAEGLPLGDAIAAALAADAAFDLPTGLATLFAEGLVSAIALPTQGNDHV